MGVFSPRSCCPVVARPTARSAASAVAWIPIEDKDNRTDEWFSDGQPLSGEAVYRDPRCSPSCLGPRPGTSDENLQGTYLRRCCFTATPTPDGGGCRWRRRRKGALSRLCSWLDVRDGRMMLLHPPVSEPGRPCSADSATTLSSASVADSAVEGPLQAPPPALRRRWRSTDSGTRTTNGERRLA